MFVWVTVTPNLMVYDAAVDSLGRLLYSLLLVTIISDVYFERFFFHRVPKGIVGVIHMLTLFCIGFDPYP